jgi:N-acetylmuramoyl-L-alanine amidase
MTKIKICGGHSYSTSGKGVPGMKEYEFNRAVAEYVRQELVKYKDVEVSFTHEDGRDVPLKERTDEANAWGADAYISIHANAGPASATGLESFIHPRADRDTKNLGYAIHKHLIRLTGMRDRKLKTADYHVLRETKMPAVLVECGFMTNKEDLVLLKNDKYRKNCALAIVRGLEEHFKLVKQESKSVYFNTGGYGGDSLAKIHSFLTANNWWYQPSRAENGSIFFSVGGFKEDTEAKEKMENFLKENKYWYQIK